jgi:type II secretory pathway component GspD/PulD (secretin)
MGKKVEKYCRYCIWVLLIILLFISPLTVMAGQDSILDKHTALAAAGEKLRTPVTLTCVNSPIEKVLMDLAGQAKIDIIKSPEVTANVTVKVTDIPLEEALTNILSAYNCTYIATENMIRVMPLPEMFELKEQQLTRIYQITYADANQVYATLDKFKSSKGEIGFIKGTSHIMITDTEDKIKAIDRFIEEIDRITEQVLVEVRIYDVTTKEGFELDPKWHLGRNAPYTGSDYYIPKEVVETETGPESSSYEEFRKELQWERRDPIDNPIVNPVLHYPDPNWAGTLTSDPDYAFPGIYERNETQWFENPGRNDTETTWTEPGIATDWRRKPFVGGSFDRVEGGSLSFSVLNDAIDLNFVLSVLHSQIEARLLANPRILVLDNGTANFEIVREIPYREVREVPREDPTTYTDFKKVGVDLKVTPHIARDGMLRLHIVPRFSVLVSQDLQGVPTIDNRLADTKAMIRDGQTIVIGGLRKREVTKGVSKVPVLADMPLVGGLFSSETESVAVNELIVFITTRIITEPTLSESEKKLLGETAFTSPEPRKTRIEKGEFEKKTEVEKTKAGKTEDEEADITETLDLLLKKLGPSNE